MKGNLILIPIGEINQNKLTKLNNNFKSVLKNKKVVIAKELSEINKDDCQILIASLGITNFTQVKNLKNQLDLQPFEVLGWLSL